MFRIGYGNCGAGRGGGEQRTQLRSGGGGRSAGTRAVALAALAAAAPPSSLQAHRRSPLPASGGARAHLSEHATHEQQPGAVGHGKGERQVAGAAVEAALLHCSRRVARGGKDGVSEARVGEEARVKSG